MVGGRQVDFRLPPPQQLRQQLLRPFEVTAEELAFRAFQPEESEHQFVLANPIRVVEQRHAGSQIYVCRRIGRRRLSPFARHVGRSSPRAFSRPGPTSRAAPRLSWRFNFEHMLGELVRRHAREQHASDAQVDFGTVLLRNQ